MIVGAVTLGAMADLHADVAPLAFLVGIWEGAGVGIYPTIESFEYEEHIEITVPPKPFLMYTQRTRRAGTNEPLHMETGYLRCPTPTTAELIIAQPTGIAEVHSGTIEGTSVHFASTSVARTLTAKVVDTVERILTVDGNVLRYELFMGAVGEPHQIHLKAELKTVLA